MRTTLRHIYSGFWPVAVAVALAAPLGAAIERGVAVSPGGALEESRSAPSCPTFSWGLLLSDRAEISVEPMTADGALDPTRRARSWSLPGTASSWSPSNDDCLEPGSWSWAVRGLGWAQDETAASDWSAPRFFTVGLTPTDDEIERALDVLRRAREIRSSSLGAASEPPAAPGRGRETPAPAGAAHRREASGAGQQMSRPTSWAIGAEVDTAGSVAIYGASSSDGKAAQFDGDVAMSGGLTVSKSFGDSGIGGVIEATAQGGLNHWAFRGLSDQGGEAFLGIRETGVFGKATTATGIGVLGQNLHGGPAVRGIAGNGGNAGDFQGDVAITENLEVGNTLTLNGNLSCSGCVSTTDLAPDSIGNSHLQNFSVGANEIADDSIHHSHIQQNAVRGDHIYSGSISSEHLDFETYNSKSDLVVVTNSESGFGLVSATAECPANTLPLTGGCRAGGPLFTSRPLFNFQGVPPTWDCTGYDETQNHTVQAYIYCLRQ